MPRFIRQAVWTICVLLSCGVSLRAAEARSSISRSNRVEPEVWAESAHGPVRVVVVLSSQPQRDILRSLEPIYAPLSSMHARFANGADSEQWAKEIDRETLWLRQVAAEQIAASIGPQQAAVAREIEAGGGGEVRRFTAVNAIGALVTPQALAALAADPAVTEVALDARFEGGLEISVPSFGAPAFWSAGFDGTGQSVAVLDTGVRSDHPAFAQAKIVGMVSLAVASKSTCFNDDLTPNDNEGHGSSVSGIVVSQGTTDSLADSNRLGVAYRATLYSYKAGYNCNNAPYTYYSDGLNAMNQLVQSTPVRIMNYSYGGVASVDDDTYSRLFDQIADTYDVNLTYCAGNSGPAGNTLWSPGSAYNGIDVANVNDQHTVTRSDDAVYITSSRGPTVGGRKKPDIAAPGTFIGSPSISWASGTLWSYWTGTSMAAPHVAGGALLLQQSGVTSALARKAILLNSTDQGAWAADLGWGYGNLTRAFAQRDGYVLGSLASAGQTGSVQFYRLKNANGGAVTATLVWNRHPALNDLNLYAYDGSTNALTSSSTSTVDNVEKVSVSNGTNLLLKAANNSAAVTGGLANEPFALAASGSMVPLSGPGLRLTFNPTYELPGAGFAASVTVTNTGDMSAFNVDVTLTIPPGFTIAGSNLVRAAAQLAPGASQTVNWSVVAPGVGGTFSAAASASSRSFDENFSANAIADWTVSTTPTSVQPQSGWWWDPKLSGTGFFVEYGGKSGNGIFLGGFLYDESGNNTWLVSTGQMSGSTYTNTWLRTSGGQTLTGAYKAPTQTTAGNVSITFPDSTHAVMTRPDGTQINLARFSFSLTSTPAPPIAGAPQSGWWWAGSSASGTGYGVEIQGNAVFIVAYVYDAAGNPVWYLATGNLTSPTSYSGNWDVYAGGPQLASPEGTYSAHTVAGASVPMSLTFSDATHGTLTMGSVSLPIVRFQEF